MNLLGQIKDHILIGGPNAIAGWGLLVLLVFSRGIIGGHLMPGLDPLLFVLVLLAATFTGNGVYALNAYYDVEADRINKPNRPIPSGRMTPEHALKYSLVLMALGFSISVVASLWTGKLFMSIMWSIFTLLGIAYSKPPFKLKARHIFGNLCFAVFHNCVCHRLSVDTSHHFFGFIGGFIHSWSHLLGWDSYVEGL